MNDRDCDNCAHHSEGGCSVWECSFEQKDDTISRQAAIGALCGECQANCIPCESFPCGEIKAVQALPSAQTDSCNGCKWENAFGYGECHHCKRRYDDMYEVKDDE